MVSSSGAYASGQHRSTARRAQASSYDPLKERAKLISDVLWERAKNIAKVLAPDVPADQQELDPKDQWMLLERVAINLSPEAWDDPNAIRDLYQLRKQFAPQLAFPWLLDAASYRQKEKSLVPRADISPASPEFEKLKRRLSHG